MDRRHAWITAGIIAVTFITAALAMMANTGLLALDRPSRRVGQILPAALVVSTTQLPTAGPTGPSTTPNTIAQYEDVYVSDSTVSTVSVPILGPTSRSMVSRRAPKMTSSSTNPSHTNTHDGEPDDD